MPRGHAWHTPAEAAPGMTEKAPGGHKVQAVWLRLTEYDPGWHDWHDVWFRNHPGSHPVQICEAFVAPVTFQYNTISGHWKHADEFHPVWSMYVPEAQAVQLVVL